MKRIYKVLIGAGIVAQILALLRRRKEFVPDVPMLASCKECKQRIQLCAGNRLTVHLIRDHNIPEEEVYKTVDWVMHQVQADRRRKQGGKETRQ